MTSTGSYYYSEARTTHVSDPDGTQLYHFPNGQVCRCHARTLALSPSEPAPPQVERHFTDGLKEIKFEDGAIKIIMPGDGVQSLGEVPPYAPAPMAGIHPIEV